VGATSPPYPTGESMSIPGVPDEHLARTHWRHGGGRGALGYVHLPTGISVYRECSPGASVHAVDAELLIELREALRSRGILPPDAALHHEPD
jgi:hypothetical protein